MILLAGKNLFAPRDRFRTDLAFPMGDILPGVGTFGRRVGIEAPSRIGHRLIELLRPSATVRPSPADPYADAAAWRVRRARRWPASASPCRRRLSG
ncbi:hypothetical protein ACWGDT_07515 [Streptomyces avermitilis]